MMPTIPLRGLPCASLSAPLNLIKGGMADPDVADDAGAQSLGEVELCCANANAARKTAAVAQNRNRRIHTSTLTACLKRERGRFSAQEIWCLGPRIRAKKIKLETRKKVRWWESLCLVGPICQW